jgi:hypothetical protein
MESVEAIQNKGLSPSGGLILKLKQGTTYNGDDIEQCFLKFWQNGKADEIRALNYEMWVYSHVVRSLVDNRVCPNFNRYLFQGKRCKKENLLAISNNAFKGMHIRESEQDYRLLVTEYLHGMTIAEYLRKKLVLDEEVWLILCQLAIACYALFLSKTTHNDLHAGNVMLVPNKDPITYNINDEICTITPLYIVKVFDFDHAYVERYRPNRMLTDHLCNTEGYCNELVQGTDVCSIFGIFYRHFQEPKILDILFKGKPVVDGLQWNAPRITYDSRWYDDHINPLQIIITKLKEEFLYSEIPCNNMYNCSAIRFDTRGNLRPEFKVNELQKVIDEKSSISKSVEMLKQVRALNPKQLQEYIAAGTKKLRHLDSAIQKCAEETKKREELRNKLKTETQMVDSQMHKIKSNNEFVKKMLVSIGTTGLAGASLFLQLKYLEWLTSMGAFG